MGGVFADRLEMQSRLKLRAQSTLLRLVG